MNRDDSLDERAETIYAMVRCGYTVRQIIRAMHLASTSMVGYLLESRGLPKVAQRPPLAVKIHLDGRREWTNRQECIDYVIGGPR